MDEQNCRKTGVFVTPDEMKLQEEKARTIAALFEKQGRVAEKAPGCFLQTFGCQQNEADSERMAGYARLMGYRIVEEPKDADLILVNTCAIREHAEKKVFSIVGQYSHIKAKNPGLVIGVGGCMVTQEHRANQFKMSYPHVNFTFDTGSIYRLPELILNALQGGKRSFLLTEDFRISEGIPTQRVASFRAWLPIMYGCNNFCSYCIVPYVRGRERSRRAEDIIEEAKRLVASGVKEITLLGQNVNSYGNDAEDAPSIAELIHRICAIDGDFVLRFMTSHPKDASDELIQAMAEEEKLVKHFHLPVQAGSDPILKTMNRKYNVEKYMERMSFLKKTVPDVSITTDIIVGFPGETEEDFEGTMKLLADVAFDAVFSFIYSPRKGTPAAKMENQIPHEVSTERMARLLDLQGKISAERSGRFVGRKLRLLTEEVSRSNGHFLTGRGEPVRPVHFEADPSLIGQFVNVEITNADPYAMYGKLV